MGRPEGSLNKKRGPKSLASQFFQANNAVKRAKEQNRSEENVQLLKQQLDRVMEKVEKSSPTVKKKVEDRIQFGNIGSRAKPASNDSISQKGK